MSQAATTPIAPEEGKSLQLRRIVIGALVIVVIGAAADLLGWDLRGWFDQLWDTITGISLGYLLAAIALKTLQTTATAFAWYAILRYAYPAAGFRLVLACYAASVALNGILPANLGTLMLLLMLTATIAAATFSGVLGAYVVQKIFFTLSGAFTYLYLFLSVSGSFDIKFEFVHENPWATAVLLLGGIFLIYLLIRAFWPRVVKWWDDAKEGGAILGAHDIPVSFDTLMRIAGGNSIANVTSVTPGGAGVNQAFNVASLNGVTDPTTATAYSVAQQFVTTAWNILFAIIMLTWVFGWSGGKELVSTSYVDAKEKAAEQKASRAERKEAKRAAKEAARNA